MVYEVFHGEVCGGCGEVKGRRQGICYTVCGGNHVVGGVCTEGVLWRAWWDCSWGVPLRTPLAT